VNDVLPDFKGMNIIIASITIADLSTRSMQRVFRHFTSRRRTPILKKAAPAMGDNGRLRGGPRPSGVPPTDMNSIVAKTREVSYVEE